MLCGGFLLYGQGRYSMPEQQIREFLSLYESSLHNLVALLDEARISHYSSGCGTKGVTFEIFPASDQIMELLRMVSLDRAHKATTSSGLKDVSTKGGPNPANDFMLYLRRWSGFAEQVMKREGDSPRGVAAARARLIADNLIQRLGEDKSARFLRLMETVGLLLLARKQSEDDRRMAKTQEARKHNYLKAMAAAQGNTSSESRYQAA